MGKIELVALLCLPSWCRVIGIVLWFFLVGLGDGQRCVVVVFPDYTHLLSLINRNYFIKVFLILNK